MTTEILAAGAYRARAKDWGLGETTTGKEQVAVSFELLDEEVVGRVITWYGYFTEKTTDRTIQSLRHCGWKGTDLSVLEGLNENEVSLVVEHDTYKDKVSAKVAWVNSAGGLAVKAPLQPDKAKAFAARMKAAVLAADMANGTPKAVKSPEPPAHTDLDAPPF